MVEAPALKLGPHTPSSLERAGHTHTVHPVVRVVRGITYPSRKAYVRGTVVYSTLLYGVLPVDSFVRSFVRYMNI